LLISHIAHLILALILKERLPSFGTLKAGDFVLLNPPHEGHVSNPDENHQYRNKGNVPFKMICGVPKEFE
jgi:hypothetical protein